MATTFRQLTFVDTTESGLINIESVRHQIKKYGRLKSANRKLLKSAFCTKFDVSSVDYDKLLNEKKSFTTEQFYDFRDAVQYYADREKFPNL